ncbi:MAG: tRNA (guanosine(37)-N1)-methyltransferase TrmD [Campylobacterota bacterium]
MRFTFVTLFPELIQGYFASSILSLAKEAKHIDIAFENPREYTTNKHNKVDDYMVGGGAGLVMTAQPLFDTLKQHKDKHIIFTTPGAKPFRQNDAVRLSRKREIVFVCGRYEGIDERVIEEFADEVFSIGDYILTGGELASMVMADSISRNVEGVLGNSDSLSVESFNEELLEAPSFAKPKEFENLYTPSEFSKGNHSKIAKLKSAMSIAKTKYFRPDLYKKYKARQK